MTTETPERIIRIKTVLERTGLSRSTLYRKMQDGSFPKSVRISLRCAGWREAAVNTWLHNRLFYSDDERARKGRLSCSGPPERRMLVNDGHSDNAISPLPAFTSSTAPYRRALIDRLRAACRQRDASEILQLPNARYSNLAKSRHLRQSVYYRFCEVGLTNRALARAALSRGLSTGIATSI